MGQVQKGPRPGADRILLVGTEGIGKSTFASEAPSPIFISAEDGLRHLDVSSFPERAMYKEIYSDLGALLEEDHEYQTVVIDTVDWLEPMIWQEACQVHGWDNIESPGYGKGYVLAMDFWRGMLSMLDSLRMQKGMEVILIGHSQIKNFSNPVGSDYSRYELALQRAASALLKQWADSVLFANHEESTYEDGSKTKGRSTGRRMIHTERTTGWDAKSRWQLPSEMPLSYEEYSRAREKGLPASSEDLYVVCYTLFQAIQESLSKEEAETILNYLEASKGNSRRLQGALNRLKAKEGDMK